MKLSKIIASSSIVGILSMTLSVAANAQAEGQPGMPVAPAQASQQADSMEHMKMHQQHMQQLQAGDTSMMEAGCDHMKMNPAMGNNNMMQMRQQRMWQGDGAPGRMPMMDPAMRQNMMQMRQQKTRMMKQRANRAEMMQMRQQHMQTMEQRLSNIEKLLTELVELQKSN